MKRKQNRTFGKHKIDIALAKFFMRGYDDPIPNRFACSLNRALADGIIRLSDDWDEFEYTSKSAESFMESIAKRNVRRTK